MNTRNIFTKLSIAIALVALAATGAVWQIRRVHAMPTMVEDQARFGMVGLTRGQTMRLNVVNLIPPPDSEKQFPPDPCRVVLSFRNASGQPFNNTLSDSFLARTVTLQPGESAFLDLDGDQYAPPSTNADVEPGPARMQLRPFVRVVSAPNGHDYPPDPCRTTMEVFDNTSGRTSLFALGRPNFNPDGGQ